MKKRCNLTRNSFFTQLLRRVVYDDIERIASEMNQDDMYRLGEQLDIPTKEINTSFVNNLSGKKTNNMTPKTLTCWSDNKSPKTRESFVNHFGVLSPRKLTQENIEFWWNTQPMETRTSFMINFAEVTSEKATSGALKLWLNAQPTDVNTSFIKTFPAENTKKANLEILKSWLKKQSSREDAYNTMGEALIDAGLPLIAREVLDYPPPKLETTENGKRKKRKKRKYSDMRQETCSNDVPCS